MKIYTVVYVGDGALYDVDTFTDRAKADARYNEHLKEQGYCVESGIEKGWHDIDPNDPDALVGFFEQYAADASVTLTEIDGKHYHPEDCDCLVFSVHEIDERKCVWIPDEEVIEQKLGRKPTDLEVMNVQHAFENGIEGQVDWQMAFDCAIEEA